MAKPDLGVKRQCLNCGTKFFDLSKNPITCPKCGTIFEVANATAATRSSRAAAQSDDEDTDTDETAEVVSLEDADQTDDGKVSASTPDDDADGDDEDDSPADDDDTFLEEEEDDGDVSGLVDGDREDDDER